MLKKMSFALSSGWFIIFCSKNRFEVLVFAPFGPDHRGLILTVSGML